MEPQLQNLMENIVRRGRVKGFIPWLITQRPASISKDVLSQVDGLVAMKLTGKHDRDALGAWIEGQADKSEEKEFKAKLPTMQRGHGIVWIPGRQVLETVKFPTKTTFDSSSTPKRGETRRTAQLRPIDIGKLKSALAAIETEHAKPKSCKVQPGAAPAQQTVVVTQPDPAALRQAEDRGRALGFEEGRRVGQTEGHSEALRSVQLAIGAIKANEPTLAALPIRKAASPVAIAKDATACPAGTKLTAMPKGLPEGFKISKPMQRVLDTLAWLQSVGVIQPRKDVVAYLSKASVTSSSFTNNLGALKNQAGLIEYRTPGTVCLTLSGNLFAEAPARAISLADFHGNIKEHLEGPQRKILDVLVSCYPKQLAKDVLADRVGASPTSSSFTNNLGRLRSLGFIDYPTSGFAIATSLLFPEGYRSLQTGEKWIRPLEEFCDGRFVFTDDPVWRAINTVPQPQSSETERAR